MPARFVPGTCRRWSVCTAALAAAVVCVAGTALAQETFQSGDRAPPGDVFAGAAPPPEDLLKI